MQGCAELECVGAWIGNITVQIDLGKFVIADRNRRLGYGRVVPSVQTIFRRYGSQDLTCQAAAVGEFKNGQSVALGARDQGNGIDAVPKIHRRIGSIYFEIGANGTQKVFIGLGARWRIDIALLFDPSEKPFSPNFSLSST